MIVKITLIRRMYTRLLILMTSLVMLFSCNPRYLVNIKDGKKIDKRLVGKWSGSETDNQIVGMKKEWIMTRTPGGKFSLDFKITNNKKTDSWTEEGTWWIENGDFHEYHEDSGKTDIYQYEVLNENEVKFTAVKIGVEVDNETYTFIDKRVE